MVSVLEDPARMSDASPGLKCFSSVARFSRVCFFGAVFFSWHVAPLSARSFSSGTFSFAGTFIFSAFSWSVGHGGYDRCQTKLQRATRLGPRDGKISFLKLHFATFGVGNTHPVCTWLADNAVPVGLACFASQRRTQASGHRRWTLAAPEVTGATGARRFTAQSPHA